MSKKIDLYPNPGLVEAIRKDGYNKFGFDVFLVAYTNTSFSKKEDAAFEFISNAIQLTDKSMSVLKEYKNLKREMLGYTVSVKTYKKYPNTIEYLLEYYNFLIKNNLISNAYEVGARYNGGIISDYIEAVNSKEPVLGTEGEAHGSSTPKLPTEISSWFPNTEIIHYYNDHPFLIYIGGPEQRLRSWVFNMILVSMVEDKGFNYSSQKMFMNWKSNPLNR